VAGQSWVRAFFEAAGSSEYLLSSEITGTVPPARLTNKPRYGTRHPLKGHRRPKQSTDHPDPVGQFGVARCPQHYSVPQWLGLPDHAESDPCHPVKACG
jgi:hypothetical protein